ncbi:ScbR family autoregulator-binding transcription factor [Arthrobacter sp. ISL-65]|uniref:ScbR family autoregulator-binding transcription factor n=1 Tax=Arthrobacter sp. ISL-65 TaxID=2819112 RepID=UPI001BE992EB|nr:ScbR family autoregulator-binding transcription factor [Arthrobacter sp. ISL-65]MBT2547846.1 TetR/AcrR family transcriptional regulator [Arthrobacter sp. ISL-65]
MVLQDRAKATREAIIVGAAAVFEEHGYGSASLTQVSDAAKVTKGALYFHFQSKEDLARAVIEEQHRIVVAESETLVIPDRPALPTMILLCRVFGLKLVHEPVVRAGIRLTLEATAFGEPVQGPYEDWIAVMEQLTERAKREKQVRSSVDSAALARYLVASFTGVQMVSGVLTGRADVMQRIEEMWAILLPGLMHEDFNEDPQTLSGLVSAGGPGPRQG